MLLQFRDLGVTSWFFVVLRRSSWPFVDHSFTFVSDKWGPCPAGQIIRGCRVVSDKWGPCPAGQIIRG